MQRESMIYAVIAYPHYLKWMFWKSNRPFMLRESECKITKNEDHSVSAYIYHRKYGYRYRIVAMECDIE